MTTVTAVDGSALKTEHWEQLPVNRALCAHSQKIQSLVHRMGMRCGPTVPQILLFDFYCLSYTCCVFTSFPSIFALVFTVTVLLSGPRAVQTEPIFAPPFFNTPVIL